MKINFNGKEVEATPVDFFTKKEDFNEYQLTDGKILKIKLVTTKVFRIDSERDANGDALYHIRSQNVALVE